MKKDTLRWLEDDNEKLNRIQLRRAQKLARERQEAFIRKKYASKLERVAIIHWVKDTPYSLTTKFLEWRGKNAK
jgi:hypothetical protein